MVNRQIVLKQRPVGWPTMEDFWLTSAPVPEVAEGMVLVASQYLSVDPYMRGRMSDHPSYAPPFALNEVVPGVGVGVVKASRDPGLAPGDVVVGLLGWQEYALLEGARLTRVDPAIDPVSVTLGALGMPGLTAYFGMIKVAAVQAKDTVVISAAAGAVGSVACQIGKRLGARVVGVAGSEAKTRLLVAEMGVDAALNYHSPHFEDDLGSACPNGIDVYFDNVGGWITDMIFVHLNLHARVAVCGQIANYNAESPRQMPDILGRLVSRRIRVEGFLVGDFAGERAVGMQRLTEWYQEGRILAPETVIEGFEQLPRAFLGLFSGANIGKQIVHV